jgi:hypothetical protein
LSLNLNDVDQRACEMDGFEYVTGAELFDYGAEAEVFSRTSGKARPQSLGYRRFARAVDAIRFVIEELSPQLLVGTYLEVDEERYEANQIRRLYENDHYPLARRIAASTDSLASKRGAHRNL